MACECSLLEFSSLRNAGDAVSIFTSLGKRFFEYDRTAVDETTMQLLSDKCTSEYFCLVHVHYTSFFHLNGKQHFIAWCIYHG